MPGGHPLLNPHLFFTCHITARKDFLFAFLGPACVCPRGFKTVPLILVFSPLSMSASAGSCAGDHSLTLWASLPLFPCNSNMLHTGLRWKMLQRQTCAGSICWLVIWGDCRVGSVTPQRWKCPLLPAVFAEVWLQTSWSLGRLRPAFYSPLGPHFLLASRSGEHSSCGSFTPGASLSLLAPAKSSWHQL